MGQNPLFRKAAIDKLSSPERLDVLMQVTSPKGWVAIWTIGAVLAGVLLWSVFGSIPTRIDGDGILIRGGSLREIRASGEGTLTGLQVKVNDTVEVDQTIGEIIQQDVQDRVRTAQLKYEEAQREYEAATAEDRATIAQTNANIAGYEAEIVSVEAQLVAMRDDLASRRELLAKGLVTKARVQAIEQQVLALESKITGLRAQNNNLRASNRATDQRIRARATGVEMAKLEVERATSSAVAITQVKSTVAGRIIELKKSSGDRVAYAEVVAVVEPPSAVLEPIVYVNSALGKRIHSGMEAQIVPSTVKREEYGFMRAKVSYVGEYPVTPEGVMSAVANAALAQELLGKVSKIELRAALVPKEETASGYEWSSSAGPPFKVDSGTRVSMSVVVDRRPPISFVLPILRGTFGAS
jgi:HlyD family secretion protein